MKKLIFKDYLKDPLSTIAVNTTVLLFGINILCFICFYNGNHRGKSGK